MENSGLTIEYLFLNIVTTAVTSSVIYLVVSLFKKLFLKKGNIGEGLTDNELQYYQAYKAYILFGFPLAIVSLIFAFTINDSLIIVASIVAACFFSFLVFTGFIGLVEIISKLTKRIPNNPTNKSGNKKQ